MTFQNLFDDDFSVKDGNAFLPMPKEGTPLRFVILDTGVSGWEYWTTNSGPARSETKFESLIDPQSGDTKQKKFAILPVYNLSDGKVSLINITSVAIMSFIKETQKSGEFDLLDQTLGVKIESTGSGLTTKYSATVTLIAATPGTKEVKEAAREAKTLEIQTEWENSELFDGKWKDEIYTKQTTQPQAKALTTEMLQDMM